MQILGIQIDPPFIQAALIHKGKNKAEIRLLKAFPCANPDLVKQLYTKKLKKEIATGLSAKNFLIRSLDTPLPYSRYLKQAIAFRSEAASHFDPASVLNVPLIHKREDGFADVALCTVRRESLSCFLGEFRQFGIDPDGISTASSALCHFIRWKLPSLKDAIIVDLGSSEWTCSAMENGLLKKSYAIDSGIEALLASLWEDRKKILLQKEVHTAAKQIDLMLLKPSLNPNLTLKLQELRNQLARVICSFSRDSSPKPLFFTGRIDAFGHLPEFLSDPFQGEVLVETQPPFSLDEAKFAICIGLSLEYGSPNALQFRKEDFFPQRKWRRLGTYALSLLASSLFLSAFFLLWGIQRNAERMDRMANSAAHSSEKWGVLSAEKSNLQEKQEDKIENWIRFVASGGKEYSYILQTPKAAQALAWLSSHPLLKELEQEGDPIDLREIRYQLIQHPKLDSPQDPYLGKIELEFQFKNGINARKFHDALLKGDEIVDPDLEISWEALNGGYRTSFYLKNKKSGRPYAPA